MRYPYSRIVGADRLGSLLVFLLLTTMLLASMLRPLATEAAQNGTNSLVSVEVQDLPSATTAKLKTSEPVGSRYTVYDSFDPTRVVIDFPGLDVSNVAKEIPANVGPIKAVRISSFDLASGKLGRVELLLTAATKYQVVLEGDEFSINFTDPAGKEAVKPANTTAEATAPAGKTEAATTLQESGVDATPRAEQAVATPAEIPTTVVAPAEKPITAATMKEPNTARAEFIDALKMSANRVVAQLDGAVGKYQYFKLSAPPRLVVDVYGVQPRFKERTFAAANGFKQVRIGAPEGKTRMVFDANGETLPYFKVSAAGSELVIAWTSGATGSPVEPVSETQVGSDQKVSALPINVEAVNFEVKGGKSLLSVRLSAPGELIPVSAKGTTLGFGIRNATIAPNLRRTLDASAFPSAVKRVTPYTVLVGDGQDVRFAVELKGKVDYSLREEGKQVLLAVDNQAFGERTEPAGTVILPVAVPEGTPTAAAKAVAAPAAASAAAPVSSMTASEQHPPAAAGGGEIIGAAPPQAYSGQKITLVFDDADILNILQLIAEVSNLNIIASDDVKGTITLRLVDVPWDQALALIMDIKDLGMVRQGNVVRIMPKEKLRAMEEARMNASRTREKLEDLETELITVNYADLAGVSKHVKEVLTKDRDGVSVSEDARNKQLIVRDIPSNLSKIRDLVKQLDTPERQVMIEARIVEATSTFSRDLGVSWGFSSEAEHRTSELANNQFNLGFGGSFLIAPPTGGSVLDGAGMGAGFTFGKVGSTSLDLRLSALEASGEGKVISTPRISTLNGGQATISQGTKIPYQSSGTNGPKTEFVDANLQLSVTPVINPDGSMILDINATNSSVGSTVSTGTGGNAPSIDTREAKTKLLVRDGETTVIGGIFVETDTKSASGVPWLMKLPIFGQLFESTNKSNQRAELLIFITPRIVE